MSSLLWTSAVCALSMLAAGCAAVNPRAGFGDVQRLVSARATLDVAWPADDAADQAIAATVTALLTEPLTAESAMRIALLENRGLRALYHELGIAEAELAGAGLLPNPVLHANVRLGLGPSGTGAELGLVQDLIGALQIPLKKRVAGAKLATAKLEVADAVLALAFDTKATFYRLQGAQQMLELRRTVVRGAAASRQVAERQFAAGTITDLALATEQALHEEATVELTIAESAARADREDLNTLLGVVGDGATWTTAPHLAALPADALPDTTALEALALQQRLDLEATRLRTASERAQYRLGSVYGLIPAASLGSVAEHEVEGGWSVGPSLEIPIPLFDQSQAALAATTARIAAGAERSTALAVRIRADVRRARTRVDAAGARAAHYQRTLLPLATRVTAATQHEYNAMLAGVFQLLQAKRNEIDTGRRYVEALTDYWVARTELERAVGGELTLASAPVPSAPAAEPTPVPADHHHHHGG
ncbi:MAG: TolC family protein [Candidatus Binatia bacterium]